MRQSWTPARRAANATLPRGKQRAVRYGPVVKKLIASVRYEPLGDGQSPGTLFVACSDSRVVPAFLSSAEPGELFTVRNVGNLIPPADAQGGSTGDRSEASAIEYAGGQLAVRDIVVRGHSIRRARVEALDLMSGCFSDFDVGYGQLR